jgi:hypothetical protein
MSLAQCKACGHYVSKNADKCARCGKPQKRYPIGRSGAIGFLLLVGVAAAIVMSQRQSNSPDDVAATPKISADCTLQAGRKAFIRQMVEQGYWQEIERPGIILRVNVMPRFIDSTTLDDKKHLISTVSAYDFCRGGDGVLTVVDAMNGNELGHFNEYGLQWDQ